ncbi:MAG: ATP-dependent helicase [Acutalibacteraceae bacterium]
MEEIISLRQQIIRQEFKNMNNRQQEAVFTTQGPLLVLAGAGSGKTTVLVNRIANILRWGNAYNSTEVYGTFDENEMNTIRAAAKGEMKLPDDLAERLSVNAARPYRILAITFTNKAANELKERICKKVGDMGQEIWASTFHSSCARILRRFGDRLGYTSHFTVYDTEDQKKLIKDCMKELRIDEKILPVRRVAAIISQSKDAMKTPDDLLKEAGQDNIIISTARVYASYQKKLKAADAMDFDDLIVNTVLLFRNHADVLEYYNNLFQYVMVDEYQDTNMLQYELVSLLAKKYRNLCVVGDDDQSIYKFRGATIENILSFEKTYEDAQVIRLEQNYRSTQTILDAANGVIANNINRKGKTLWTENGVGEKVICYTAENERAEGDYIAKQIFELVHNGGSFSDVAILYRTNAQSQALEQVLVRSGIPYKIIGGHRFYDRREIRDMIAYLNVISNPSDNVRLSRIINVPRRGIGDRTIAQVAEISSFLGESMFETMHRYEEYEALVKSREKLSSFCRLIDELSKINENGASISEIYEKLLEKTEYIPFIRKESEKPDVAVENIEELKSSIVKYEEDNGEEATLQGFLEEVSLMTDIDSYNEESEKVVMMTLHSAKGLEFPYVFIAGMEENIFPSYQSSMSEADLQEERRLAYVGITRAKKRLFLTNASYRTLFGYSSRNRPSRFIKELPQELVAYKQREIQRNPNIEIPAPKTQRKNDIAASRSISAVSSAPSAKAVDFRVGDTVKHKAFGTGMIVTATPMGKDMLLEIAFDKVGTKKIMASFAKLTKV